MHGMEVAYAPMAMGESPMEVKKMFEDGMTILWPTLGYCKSGMRVAMLWRSASAARCLPMIFSSRRRQALIFPGLATFGLNPPLWRLNRPFQGRDTSPGCDQDTEHKEPQLKERISYAHCIPN